MANVSCTPGDICLFWNALIIFSATTLIGGWELAHAALKINSKYGDVTIAEGDNFFYGGSYWEIEEITDVRVPILNHSTTAPLIKCCVIESSEQFKRGQESILPGDRVANFCALTRSMNQFTLVAD